MSQLSSDVQHPATGPDPGARDAAEAALPMEKNWQWVGARGVIALVFGVLALFMPLVAVLALTLAFGIFILADGIVSLVMAVRHVRNRAENWWSLILRGGLGVFAGLIVLIMPLVVTLALVMFTWVMIALWAVFSGAMEISAAIRLHREEGAPGWLLGGSGLVSVVLGVSIPVVLVLAPGTGVWAMGILVGAYAIASGILLLMLSSRLRRAGETHVRNGAVAPALNREEGTRPQAGAQRAGV